MPRAKKSSKAKRRTVVSSLAPARNRRAAAFVVVGILAVVFATVVATSFASSGKKACIDPFHKHTIYKYDRTSGRAKKNGPLVYFVWKHGTSSAEKNRILKACKNAGLSRKDLLLGYENRG